MMVHLAADNVLAIQHVYLLVCADDTPEGHTTTCANMCLSGSRTGCPGAVCLIPVIFFEFCSRYKYYLFKNLIQRIILKEKMVALSVLMWNKTQERVVLNKK